MLTLCAAVALLLVGLEIPTVPPLPPSHEHPSSLTLADDATRRRFDHYRERLDADPVRYASQLATLARVERSDVDFVLSIGGRLEGATEGKITTDGERVLLVVSDVGGPEGEVASLDSRIAHELEHARQFDAGELALACDPTTGIWASHYESYDVGDEVKAWNAQLALADSSDFWERRDGVWRPTLLRRFADERTEAGRANVLKHYGYGRVNPELDTDLCMDVRWGYAVGQLVRPDPTRGLNVFGRVARVEDARLAGPMPRRRRPLG